ncbi:NAD(P)/FAD-dependent oxidoreductase [Halorhodospira halophila]|uniref:Amine oxidase n=1 Tax=Halorhodospira halophila (strain DSM 244 / SL1) TaxID=349124 RepID=A1WXA4_HALHL|nr:NAD(P)/FAD-dependent oxidoreductase [Halorhodospira halophila]ABM62316.1 amine oxidase [Halorhodospira halophila SL1]MBK1730083.1 FAD-dependent oxidoreductase [Halorhodospira halophila]
MAENTQHTRPRVAIIGGGPMGLAVAYELLLRGHPVDIYEAGPVLGGMSAAFEFSGTAIERYYHFICATDESMFALLRELDLEEALHWQPTEMGYFIDGELHDWGNPVALLKLPHLDLISKFRYGVHAYLSTQRRNWASLDRLEATRWLRRWVGDRAYDLLWRKLFELKFYEHTDRLSAAWIWTRIKRVGTSRYNLMQEKLGYLEGGSQTLLDALQAQIEARGGRIHLNRPVEEVVLRDGAVQGLRIAGEASPYSTVFSTVPLPLLPSMIPDLPASVREQIQALENLAVVCVIFKLRRPVSDKFWVNINDQRMDIPGIVEYTNLRPMDAHIVYVPYYMPGDNPKYQDNNQAFIDRAWRYLQMINPTLQEADRLDAYASRYRYSQPVCEPGHLQRLPPVDLPIAGLYAADTSYYYYPEDRGISESVRYGRAMARFLE